ncbi:YbaK/EbsC family protein [Geodermatophilus sabuli]|uniref:Cys-tRNA(Pro) deacylase, prolyl-tRNA editing enzyme YbaK/EbsC n=1 Tax=Geodermatophilus sabuli TaxID=1564158 RepID=A0A285E601_9ACTN|nr:YbaK/EbsC family protein [Geodermatophilus sabuli]MBB3082594.1 prolyl-tRNA editing enzyme YbaK/EbsC (Cys-tRNA(Pro) deacylase) [Geodermatophilus sabuli]SNX94538.1 Cys-tRNA(Pro) deacylase, prolyl-tRNA editing enzyme YbaK/EbsC [Geodermatophilus sabuli]
MTPVQRVVAALHAAGVDAGVRRLDVPVPTAAAAAEALGCDVGAIANSLVFDADGEPLLVLASGAHRVDTAKVAALVGATRVRRASSAFVTAATGQEVGGVAPTGHPAPLRTVVDVDLAAYPLLWAGGGDHHTMFSVNYADLLRLTGGEEAAVA